MLIRSQDDFHVQKADITDYMTTPNALMHMFIWETLPQEIRFKKKYYISVEHGTLDLKVVSLNHTLGVEITDKWTP